MTDLLVRAIEPADSQDMRALFLSAFSQYMSEELWQWKYGDKHGHGIGVWRNKNLVAHYGGVIRKILDAGMPALAIQGTDAAVIQSERGILTKRGAYYLAATHFHEAHMGYATPHLYGFGFPSHRHYRLANKLGLYEEVDRILEFSLPPAHNRLKNNIKKRAVVADAGMLRCSLSLQRGVRRAWHSMQRELSTHLLGVRDLDYLIYRYANHPLHQYKIIALLAWPFGPINCLAIVRELPEQRLEWLDFIGNPTLLSRMASFVQHYAAERNFLQIFGWITASQRSFFSCAGAVLSNTDIIVPANVWSHAPSPLLQKERWWLTSGDTDFH